MIWNFVKLLFSGPLDRILDTVDRKFENDIDKEKLRTDITKEYIKAASLAATQRDPLWRAMQMAMVMPFAFWFASVCVYSVFWCADCAYPQTWTIAALPYPLDTWGGAMVGSLFVMKGVQDVMSSRR